MRPGESYKKPRAKSGATFDGRWSIGAPNARRTTAPGTWKSLKAYSRRQQEAMRASRFVLRRHLVGGFPFVS